MLKMGVQRLVSEWDESLHFPGETYWKVKSGQNPQLFFASLPIIFPYGKTILFEGEKLGLTAKSLYKENPAQYVRQVVCDQISPVPESFHVEFSQNLANSLCQIIANQGMAAAFYHFKGYSENELTFSFHTFSDSFEAELVISRSLAEAVVKHFAIELGQKVEAADFPPNRYKKLKQINAALNPSWWSKVKKTIRL